MSDEQLVRVRDKTSNEIGYIGRAWLDRWPDDFEEIGDADTDPAPAPSAPTAAPQQPAAPQPQSRF